MSSFCNFKTIFLSEKIFQISICAVTPKCFDLNGATERDETVQVRE